MRRFRWTALPCLVLAFAAALLSQPTQLPPWTKGTLDIHHSPPAEATPPS